MANQNYSVEALTKLSRAELLEIQENVAEALRVTESAAKDDARQKMLELAKESGFDISELFGAKAAPAAQQDGRRGRTIRVKYRNPENHEETWTGMGRMPVWLKEKVDAGADKEDFLV